MLHDARWWNKDKFSHILIMIYNEFSSNLAPKRGAYNIRFLNSNFIHKFGYKFCKVICCVINHWFITISKTNKIWNYYSIIFSKKRHYMFPSFGRGPQSMKQKKRFLRSSFLQIAHFVTIDFSSFYYHLARLKWIKYKILQVN
jgi:hypothetical protein